MNFQDSSFLQSSVNSYMQAEGQSNPRSREFIKFLHQKLNKHSSPYREEEFPQSSPLIRRSQSQDAFNSKSISPRFIEKPNTFHNRFYESIVQSSNRNYTAEFPNISKDEKSYKQILLETQNEQLKKDIKSLKEQIKYLTEKNQNLQKNNENLLGYKSRAEILDRQYNKLLNQYNKLKQERRFEENYGTSFFPLSLDQIHLNYEHGPSNPNQYNYNYFPHQSKTLKGKEVSSRILQNEQNRQVLNQNRISWKKVAGVHPSPIYKLENNKKNPFTSPYDDLPLIQSKVDSNEDEKGSSSSPYYFVKARDQTKTVDLKDFQKSKSKEFEQKMRSIQQQLIDTRKKNIDLYKKCEQFQVQKLNYLETITQLKYEKAKQFTESKNKEKTLQKQVETFELEKQANKITLLQLEQQICSLTTQMNLMKIEKQELKTALIESKEKYAQKQRKSKDAANTQEIERKYNKIKEQFEIFQNQITDLNKKINKLEIEKKLLEYELNQKKQSVIQLEKEISNQKALQSSISKEPDQLEENSNLSKIQQAKKQAEIQKLRNTILQLREDNTRIQKQKNLLQGERYVLHHENIFLRENCEKLTRIFQHEKKENMKLNQLRQSWRQIEKKTKEMKRINLAVDHLWQIKEVEYGNINTILQHINSQQSGQLQIGEK